MINDPHVSLFEIVTCLSNSMDLISKNIVEHHKRVAYIAYNIASEMGLSTKDQNNIIIAALLHDSGALSCQERYDILQFDMVNPHKHAEVGFHILKNFKPFEKVAQIVRSHHRSYKSKGSVMSGEEIPLGSYIIHIADRVDVLIDKNREILGQAENINNKIKENTNNMFHPDIVKVFSKLSERETFWFDLIYSSIRQVIRRRSGLMAVELSIDELLCLAELFRQIIDFRSPFTATHSSGVAATAERIAGLAGFSERERKLIKIAGYFHDLGKLAIPLEILEKPLKLTKDEMFIVKRHAFYSYILLEPIKDLETINTWGALHHERLDGTGYPFHHNKNNLPLGSRIMAVADIFTALTEERPYREGMSTEKAMEILIKMAEISAVDILIVSLLNRHYNEIDRDRKKAQEDATKLYQNCTTLFEE